MIAQRVQGARDLRGMRTLRSLDFTLISIDYVAGLYFGHVLTIFAVLLFP